MNNQEMEKLIVSGLDKSLPRNLLDFKTNENSYNIPLFTIGYNFRIDYLRISNQMGGLQENLNNGVVKNITNNILNQENKLFFDLLKQTKNEYKISNENLIKELYNAIWEFENKGFVLGNIVTNYEIMVDIQRIMYDIQRKSGNLFIPPENIQDSIFNVDMYPSNECKNNEIYILAKKENLGVLKVCETKLMSRKDELHNLILSYSEKLGILIFDDMAILHVKIEENIKPREQKMFKNNKYRFISKQ